MTEAQKKWIEELRTSNHVQGKFYTHKNNEVDPFGVACRIFGVRGRELRNGIVLYDNHAHQPSEYTLRVLGIRRSVNIERDLVSQVHRLNDEKGLTFAQIAEFLTEWFKLRGRV